MFKYKHLIIVFNNYSIPVPVDHLDTAIDQVFLLLLKLSGNLRLMQLPRLVPGMSGLQLRTVMIHFP